jgi:hypothetical protein
MPQLHMVLQICQNKHVLNDSLTASQTNLTDSNVFQERAITGDEHMQGTLNQACANTYRAHEGGLAFTGVVTDVKARFVSAMCAQISRMALRRAWQTWMSLLLSTHSLGRYTSPSMHVCVCVCDLQQVLLQYALHPFPRLLHRQLQEYKDLEADFSHEAYRIPNLLAYLKYNVTIARAAATGEHADARSRRRLLAQAFACWHDKLRIAQVLRALLQACALCDQRMTRLAVQ